MLSLKEIIKSAVEFKESLGDWMRKNFAHYLFVIFNGNIGEMRHRSLSEKAI